MRNITKKNILIRLLFFVSIIVVSMILTIIPSLVYSLYLEHDYIISVIGLIIGAGIYGGFAWFLIKFWKKQSIEYNVFESKKEKLFSNVNIIYLVITLVIYLTYHVCVSHYFSKLDQHDYSNVTWYFILVVFIFQALIAPIVEELITRGVFFSLFFREDKEWNIMLSLHLPLQAYMIRILVASVVSVFLSSTLHGAMTDMAMYGLILNGALCVLLYYKTKHIFYPIALHMFNNLIVIISLVLYMLQHA